jgi:signal transduction histidine kinase
MTLDQFILSNMEPILVEWERFARGIPEAKGMDARALRDHAAKILQAISRDLQQAQTPAEQAAKSKGLAPDAAGPDSAATLHGTDRYTGGFDLDSLLSEYRALRASVSRLWTPGLSTGNREMQLCRFHEAIDQALHESVFRYSEELDRSRELFLGILGHDLRNPLAVCLSSAQYLLQSHGMTAEQTKAASRIVRSSTTIQNMVGDLLDVARTRLGSGMPVERSAMDLLPTCRHAVDEAHAFHPGSAVELESTGELRGSWDETRMYQLLANLVSNALRHGASGRPVTLRASGEPAHVVLSVHNEGEPIAPSQIRRIFEPMVQTGEGSARSEGLGLGLFIAQAIVDAHHGTITVESSARDGTTFTVRMPRAAPA